MSSRVVASVLSVAALAACSSDGGVCEPQGTVVITSTIDPVGVDDTKVVVRGTADHTGGLAIRSIAVNGVAATPDTFNFGTWSASLLRDPLQGEDADLEIIATDACGTETPPIIRALDDDVRSRAFTSLSISLYDDPKTPAEPTELFAASGRGPLVLEVSANPEARGGDVVVTASRGSLTGVGNGGVLELDNEGMGLVTLQSAEGGAIVVKAVGGGFESIIEVLAVAKPSFSPAAATLVPGS